MDCHFPPIPRETSGPRSRGSAPRASQKGGRRVGGSFISDPKGTASRSCHPRPQRARKESGAQRAAEDEGRGGAYRTGQRWVLGGVRSRRSARRTCRDRAAAPPAPRPRPGHAPATPPRGGAHAPRLPSGLGASVRAPGRLSGERARSRLQCRPSSGGGRGAGREAGREAGLLRPPGTQRSHLWLIPTL